MTTYLVQLQPLPSKLGTSTHMAEETVESDVWHVEYGALVFFDWTDCDGNHDNTRAYAPGTWREVRIKAEPEPVKPIGVIVAEDATDGD